MKDQSNGNRGAIGDLKELTRSEARFQQSVDLSPEVVLSLDERGIILYWNQCCERIWGCSAEETLGVDFASQFVEPSQNDLVVEVVSRVFRGEAISGLELDFVAHNGIKRNMIFRAHPINDGSGKVIECLLVGSGVNDLIQAEEALQASERRYRHLTENSLTGIYIHQDGVFTYVNDRLATMMGYSVEEVIGKEFWSFVHPEDRQAIKDRGLAISEGQSLEPNVTFRVVCKDGRKKWFEVLSAPIEYRGRTANMGNVADVTERKLAEEALQKAHEELENRVLGRTAELSKINEQLRHEIDQRELAEANLANELTKFHALYDLAVAMSGERSLDENLSLVVEQSKNLLRGDTSYIALRDEAAGHLYMHTLSGVKTTAFKKMKIPFGDGLGGKVANNGKGCIVEDYFQEIESTVHDLVRAEGLISGLAVPIQMGEKDLGVLYVFNRTKTLFAQSDLDTLFLLGNLAAVEITRKRVEQELREARDQLEKRVAKRTEDLKKANEKLVLEIEERRKTQEALLRSDQMLNKILSSSPLGISYVEQGELKWTNQAMSDMFGHEGEKDYLGKGPADFYASEEEYRRVRELFRQSLDQGVPAETEALFVRKDGSEFYGRIRMSAVDRSDIRRGTISTITDISEKRLAEEQQRESDERYRTLVEESFDGIFVQKRSKIVFANARLHEMLGYDHGDLTGKEHWIVYHPDYRDITRERAKARLRGENVTSQYEVRLLRKDGSSFTGEINARAVLLGNEPGIQVWVRDIDERKQAEEALRESEEKYRTIIENIEEVYYQVDLDGVYTFLNEAAAKSFGYDVHKMLGRSFREFVSKEEADRTYRTFNRVFNTGKSIENHRMKYIAGDGSERSLEISVSPVMDSTGRVTGFRGICRDVTERKRVEEELLKLEKLESIGVLAGGIAHDFNNILTSIQGNISAARMDASLAGESLKRLAEAQKATIRARDLTHQLLIFAKGGAPIKKAAAVSDIVTDSCKFALRGSNVRCDFSIPEDIWTVEVDAVQISRVIGNLVINADQAMPEGGVITVTAENLTVNEEQGFPLKPGDYVMISVEDQGIGIEEEILAKIFDPYFTTRAEGTGLGLYAAHTIVASHEGLITVESVPKNGAIFHIFVPASRAETPIRQETDEGLITGSGRILIMDDDASVREVTRDLLSMLGYEVDTTNDGLEAVELYRSAVDSGLPFDLVILDLTVPGGMGGREAVQQLAEIDPNVVAIVSSGYSNDPIMADFRKFGFSGVIPKPFDAQTLGRLLRNLLRQRDSQIGKQ